MNEEIYNTPLIVGASEPLKRKGKLIYKMISDLEIDAKKSILIFNFDENSHCFTENLSKIDKHNVETYFNPWEMVGKVYKEHLDIEKLDYNIELLQEYDILMVDFDNHYIEEEI